MRDRSYDQPLHSPALPFQLARVELLNLASATYDGSGSKLVPADRDDKRGSRASRHRSWGTFAPRQTASRLRRLPRLTVVPLVGISLAACSSSDPPVEPTPAPSPTQFDGLRRWLTTERQERPADLISTVAKDHGWAAGCVFRYNANEAVLDDFPRPPGEAAYSFVNDPDLRPAIVVYVEGPVKASGSHKEVLPGSSFCYVPDP